MASSYGDSTEKVISKYRKTQNLLAQILGSLTKKLKAQQSAPYSL